MNKSDLINLLSENTNIGKSVCRKVFDETINIIKNSFYTGNSIIIKDFGKFGYKEKKQRTIYVPSLKCFRNLKYKVVPKFTPSKNFYAKIL